MKKSLEPHFPLHTNTYPHVHSMCYQLRVDVRLNLWCGPWCASFELYYASLHCSCRMSLIFPAFWNDRWIVIAYKRGNIKKINRKERNSKSRQLKVNIDWKIGRLNTINTMAHKSLYCHNRLVASYCSGAGSSGRVLPLGKDTHGSLRRKHDDDTQHSSFRLTPLGPITSTSQQPQFCHWQIP